MTFFNSPSPDIHKKLKQCYHHALASYYPCFLHKAFRALHPAEAYQANWHLDAICEYLDALHQRKIRRLIINMPPRSLKSLSVTVGWTAYMLGCNPSLKIIASSYSSAISLKHSLDVRSLVMQPWYQRTFPAFRLMVGQNEKHKFMTSQQGFRLATSVGGSLTGEGGDILIMDDPQSPAQAMSRHFRERASHWFDHTLSSRLNDKQRGLMLVVMQRLHEEDLTGHLLAKGGWEHLCLPAMAEKQFTISMGTFHKVMEQGELLQPQRETMAVLAQLKRDLGTMAFAAQYLQSPVAAGGHMVRYEWFSYYDSMPDSFDRIIQSWDTAIKTGNSHDRSACITIGCNAGDYYIIDAVAVRVDYPELRKLLASQFQHHKPDIVLIEDKASGQSLLQEIRQTSTIPVIGVIPKGSKIQRLAQITPLLEADRIKFPRYASWREELCSELLGFPHATHDDMVDALSQGINWLVSGRSISSHYIRSL